MLLRFICFLREGEVLKDILYGWIWLPGDVNCRAFNDCYCGKSQILKEGFLETKQ